jgi:phosphate transport system permease protein
LVNATASAHSAPKSARRPSSNLGDRIFALLCQTAGIFVLILLGALIIELFIAGLPAFRAFGVAFVTSTDWDPVREAFGAGVSIYGTIVTAVLAILLAVPLAFGVAFFLTELAPPWARRPLGTAIELLAAVPSIIYGMWGFFVIAPAFAQNIQPWIIENIGELPLIGFLFQGAPFGTGLFTAAFILAIMILPFIAATMRDVFEQVPPVFKESAYGLGATKWEVMKGVVLPYTRISVVGGIMLGLGRALGETMAVTFVIGNSQRLGTSLFSPGTSIASTLANEFGEADDFHLSTLFALGFLLFVITFVVLALAKWMMARTEKSKGAKT